MRVALNEWRGPRRKDLVAFPRAAEVPGVDAEGGKQVKRVAAVTIHRVLIELAQTPAPGLVIYVLAPGSWVHLPAGYYDDASTNSCHFFCISFHFFFPTHFHFFFDF